MSSYILVKHEAKKRGLHYDLRFQIPNSSNWASFALNELPPTEPGKRIYIVRTTEHSKEQALFTGTIPEGEYGAGKLTKVEGGSCTVEKFSNAHIIVDFHGSKLKGTYHFINSGMFGKKRDFTKKVYSFFKAKEKEIPGEKVMEDNIVSNYLQFLNEQMPQLATAMRDPHILKAARELIAKSGGRFSLKDAVIRALRAGGKYGAEI